MGKIILALMAAMWLTGCHRTENSFVWSRHMPVVESYLETVVMPASEGGKVFASVYVFGAEGQKLFVWALMEEFIADSTLKAVHGWSVPMLLEMEYGSHPKVKSAEVPRDGSQYESDLSGMFPAEICTRAVAFPGSSHNRQLGRKNEADAQKWFSQTARP